MFIQTYFNGEYKVLQNNSNIIHFIITRYVFLRPYTSFNTKMLQIDHTASTENVHSIRQQHRYSSAQPHFTIANHVRIIMSTSRPTAVFTVQILHNNVQSNNSNRPFLPTCLLWQNGSCAELFLATVNSKPTL
ncbi:WW domain-containing adapter protein with coiled-coil isoform X3 [Vespula maculifrons]|uniref:WW domain-containing adapter protein with coiled-coil isoform X3 n=1 Tax=Vespula maculifrons TaxID=7453 RepID=A0ABD2CMN0_VESMC